MSDNDVMDIFARAKAALDSTRIPEEYNCPFCGAEVILVQDETLLRVSCSAGCFSAAPRVIDPSKSLSAQIAKTISDWEEMRGKVTPLITVTAVESELDHLMMDISHCSACSRVEPHLNEIRRLLGG